MAGINWQVELSGFLRAAGLEATSIDQVNFGVSSVVACRKLATCPENTYVS